MIITVDGTSGSGKSTVAKKLASKLGIDLLNTGTLYRWITYNCLLQKVDINNSSIVIQIAKTCNFTLLTTDNLHNEEISKVVPVVASIPEVRVIVRQYQHDYSKNKDIIVEGRDIGTVVFPDAAIKFFVTATLDERARRRFLQLQEQGKPGTLPEIIENIHTRDNQDEHREISPLRVPVNAIEIDATTIGIDEVVGIMCKAVNVFKCAI